MVCPTICPTIECDFCADCKHSFLRRSGGFWFRICFDDAVRRFPAWEIVAHLRFFSCSLAFRAPRLSLGCYFGLQLL
jgi:hypothetical protein